MARQTGFVQAVDDAALIRLAATHNTVIVLRIQPGSYVGEGETVGWANGAPSDALKAIVIGSQRLPNQDIEFGLNQLVEIAVRAMSPAINDPFTALNCVHRLGVLLFHALRHGLPPRTRTDSHGQLRLVRPTPSFDALCDAAFHLIRQYSRGCAEVLIGVVDALDFVATHAPLTDTERVTLLRHVQAVHEEAIGLPHPADRERVTERCQKFLIE